MLRKTQKKHLADITSPILKMSDFILSDTTDGISITYKPLSWSIAINQYGEHYYLTQYINKREHRKRDSEDWNTMVGYYSLWLHDIHEENQIDKTGWEASAEEDFLNVGKDAFQARFNDSESKEILKALAAIRQALPQLKLSQDKLIMIESKIDDLGANVKSQSKFDWKSQFVGTIINLIIYLGMPQETAGIFWGLIKAAFKNISLLQ